MLKLTTGLKGRHKKTAECRFEFGPPGRPRSDLPVGPSLLAFSLHRFGFTLQERLDVVLLDDLYRFVQGFPVGVEWGIPHGRCIFLVDDLQYPARLILAAIDVDLNPLGFYSPPLAA